MQEIAILLEQTAPAVALRESVWLYPLVNAGHLLGIALVVGGIVPLDLRILGLWPKLPLVWFWRALRATVATGLTVALTTGLLLFVTRASDYLASSFFLGKMAILLLSLANAAFVAARYPLAVYAERGVSPGLKLCALLSLSGWCLVLLLGRLVGYF
ncbi:hypothetical protein DYI22_08685 [Marinobacter lipolyticus]|uniref:hypothetical protein n=1 Tax=Marinobacter lipolyticus TaxID=209639 RepID=UPI001BCE8889|nr:hypothetical protein [Marinobacter lipolyticus]MBS8240582.1 hypothetical protein [Marinobacter lipolyticus]